MKDREHPVDRYPLAWPTGWPRVPAASRARAKFRASSTFPGMTLTVAIDRLEQQITRMGGEDPVLSTNLKTGMKGMPLRDERPKDGDVGAAVYFRFKGRPIVLACDKWTTVADNIAAIAAHIDAIRAQDRYGVGRLEQALAGYQRLIGAGRAWFDVLGFKEPPKSFQQVTSARNRLALALHPDNGGTQAQMAELNAAYDTAREEFGR